MNQAQKAHTIRIVQAHNFSLDTVERMAAKVSPPTMKNVNSNCYLAEQTLM